MSSSHPIQAILATGQHLATASATTLSVLDPATNTLLAQSTPHTSLIRLLATFTEGTQSYLISTGEDKLLIVSRLPSLQLDSSRELVKRANALSVTQDGQIVVGDKFGDVYSYPLHAPVAPVVPATPIKDINGEDTPKALPLLGHVSMLNTLALIPSAPEFELPRALIVTGDRDEHVRVSRFPKGHVVEKFLWGSQNFVSALTYLAPTSTSTTPIVLSAGGDSTIQVFDLLTGTLLNKFEISSHLEKYCVVGAERPTAVPSGRRKDKAGTKKKGKGKAAAAVAEVEEVVEEVEAVTEEEKVEAIEEAEAIEEEQAIEEAQKTDKYLWRDGVSTGVAVVKLMVVGSREDGGVFVVSSGCTALLYIPFSQLLSSSVEAQPTLLDLTHPILDLTPSPSAPLTSFIATIDTSLPSPTDTPALQLLTLTTSPISLTSSPLTTLSPLALPPTPPTLTLPTNASLYPVLALLHHPDQSGGIGGDDDLEIGGGGEAGGKGRGKGRKELKRTAENSPEGKDERQKGGKRAAGRAEIKRRLEETRRKQAGEGEEVAKGEMEGETAAMVVEA